MRLALDRFIHRSRTSLGRMLLSGVILFGPLPLVNGLTATAAEDYSESEEEFTEEDDSGEEVPEFDRRKKLRSRETTDEDWEGVEVEETVEEEETSMTEDVVEAADEVSDQDFEESEADDEEENDEEIQTTSALAEALNSQVPEPSMDFDEAFEKRLSEVERKLEEAAKIKPEKKETDKKDAPKKDDWVDISSEKWTVKLGGHVQMDFIHWAQADDPPIPADDYFEFRRLRLLADGAGYGVYDFRLQIDIEPEGGDGVLTPVTDVKDAYFTANELPFFNRLRIGNFFVPTSLEQVTNDTNNIFMERSIPTQNIFSGDREVGIAMYGVSDSQNITWTFGTFLDSISESQKERIDDNQGQRLSARLTWLPYYDEPSNGRYLIHMGASVLSTYDSDNSVRFRARPQIHEGPFLIDSGALAADRVDTGGLELATVWGSFSAQSEMFVTTVNQTNGDSNNLYGMYVYGSYFLTGENRIYDRFGQHGAQFSRNVPYSNFFWIPGCMSPGAWELKTRWSYLDETQISRGAYNDFTGGVNWYWSDRTRVMFDWIHPFTTADTPFGTTSSDIIAMRFDFNW